MYKNHGWVRSPEYDDVPIIRYFPLQRFLNVLSSSSLYFARLSEFEDPYDGILPEATRALEKDHFTNLPRNPGDEFTDFEMLVRSNNRINRYCSYANCWYQDAYESDAMWKLYGRMGIAIQSSFARLRDSVCGVSEDVYIGEMEYFDFSTSQPPTYGNTLAAAFFKRIEFQHERELRAVVVRTPKTWTHGALTDEIIETQPKGLPIPVNLERLITKVILSPGTTTSTFDDIAQRLTAAGLSVPVQLSRLDEKPRLI